MRQYMQGLHTTDGSARAHAAGYTEQYRKHRIMPVPTPGRMWQVTALKGPQAETNIMPGGAQFETVFLARIALDVLLRFGADQFLHVMQLIQSEIWEARRAVTSKSPLPSTANFDDPAAQEGLVITPMQLYRLLLAIIICGTGGPDFNRAEWALSVKEILGEYAAVVIFRRAQGNWLTIVRDDGDEFGQLYSLRFSDRHELPAPIR